MVSEMHVNDHLSDLMIASSVCYRVLYVASNK